MTNKAGLFYQTDLLSVQIAGSDPESKTMADQLAAEKSLSIVDFSACEKLLKEKGVIPFNEILTCSKTDWNKNLLNSKTKGAGDSGAVSFVIYNSKGEKVDTKLCDNKNARITIKLRISTAKIGPSQNFDITSPFYNDHCMSIALNEVSATINDRKESLTTNNITCATGCNYRTLNITTGYLSCDCMSTVSDEVSPAYGKAASASEETFNMNMAKCYDQFLKYVIFIFN